MLTMRRWIWRVSVPALLVLAACVRSQHIKRSAADSYSVTQMTATQVVVFANYEIAAHTALRKYADKGFSVVSVSGAPSERVWFVLEKKP